VLYAGDRRFVFVDFGEGRLRPQAVETGLRDGERLELLSGLEAGQTIVVSGNYLIASESRLGSALEQW
jgi:Cu(I)/Ag(I) efflux system membrane fusion protein